MNEQQPTPDQNHLPVPKKRVGFLISHPIQYQSPFFRELAKEVDLVVYYCSDHGVQEHVDPGFGVTYRWDIPLLEGYAYEFLKNYSHRPSLFTFFGLINIGIVKRILKKKHDAIIIHGYTNCTSILALVCSLIARVPIFFRGETVYRDKVSPRGHLRHIFFRFFFQLFAGCFPIGTSSAKFFTSIGIPAKKLFLTPYSVDNDFFLKQSELLKSSRSQLKEKYELPNLPIILFAAKLIPRKRPHDLLIAFSQLPADSAALVFVGDGPLREELERMSKEKNSKNVFFAGFKNQTEIAEWYALADVFVLPSEYESFGLVVNEAMCFSLPIITTSCVASSDDLVSEGENGFIYPAGDIEALLLHLKLLLASAAVREEMGKKSRQTIASWNYDICVRALIQATSKHQRI